MSRELSNEQKAHDLAIAYITYDATISETPITTESFYQGYENAYDVFLNLVKRNA